MPRTIAARVGPTQMTHYLGPLIIPAITAASPFPAAGMVVGKLPANSIPLKGALVTTTAFSGGTPAGTVGTTASAASIVAVVGPGAVGNQQYTIVAGFAPTTDTEVRLFITGGATAGAGRFALEYIPPFT